MKLKMLALVALSATPTLAQAWYSNVSGQFNNRDFLINFPKEDRCLYVSGRNIDSADVSCGTPSSSTWGGQRWRMDGNMIRQARLTHSCLEVSALAEGARVTMGHCANNNNQRFSIVKPNNGPKAQYQIVLTAKPEFCLSTYNKGNSDYSVRRCQANDPKQLMHFEQINVLHPSSSNQVTLYNGTNYSSSSAMYDNSQRELIHNDTMSSFKIPAGWTVRFYEGKNFTGGYYTRNASSANDKWVDNKISSFEVLSK